MCAFVHLIFEIYNAACSRWFLYHSLSFYFLHLSVNMFN